MPILALTAAALVEERQRCLAVGMNDFVTEPFEPDRLVEVIARSVERARAA